MKPAPSAPTGLSTISRRHLVHETSGLSIARPLRWRTENRPALIDGLKARIRAIERSPDGTVPPDLPSVQHGMAQPADPADGRDAPKVSLSPLEFSRPSPFSQPQPGNAPARAWTFGAPGIDAWLPGAQLQTDALHEVKPASIRDWGAALGCVLRLAQRRLMTSASSRGAAQQRPIVWCWPSTTAHEYGRLCTAGLASLGLDPKSLLLIETAKAADTLWAMEESLRSGAAALVTGVLDEVEQTPARRLALAAAAKATPALLMTSPATDGTAAIATRWQIAAAPSAPHPFDPRAPGAQRMRLMLTRCRGSLGPPADRPMLVEWSDDASCFRVVPVLAPATAEAQRESQIHRRAG